MQKVMTIIVTVLLSFSFSHVVLAGHHHGHGEMCKKRMAKMVKQLNLSDEQQKKVELLRQQYDKEKTAMIEKYKGLRGQMQDIIKAEPGDNDKLNALIKRKQEMVADFIKMKVKMKQGIYQLLTPKQRKQFETMWYKKKEMIKTVS